MAGARRSPVGLIGSVLLHVSIIGATLFTFAHKLDISEESPPVVPVELVTIAAKTNLTPTVKVRPKAPPKEEEPVTPPQPQTAETPPPPEEKPQPEKLEEKPEPKPVETPPDTKPVEAPPPPPEAVAPEPEVKPPPPAPKPMPKLKLKPIAPKPETAKKKDQFDIDSVMALLDKRAPASKSAPNARVANRNIKGFGPQDAMTMDLQDALRSQIQQCWNPPVGAPHPEDLVVDFDLVLNQDGSVAQPPQLTGNSAAAANSNPYTRAAAEAARRAIYECAPYKLPADRYALWREINPFHFDPRQMMGD